MGSTAERSPQSPKLSQNNHKTGSAEKVNKRPHLPMMFVELVVDSVGFLDAGTVVLFLFPGDLDFRYLLLGVDLWLGSRGRRRGRREVSVDFD
mgnify:FL=1